MHQFLHALSIIRHVQDFSNENNTAHSGATAAAINTI